MRFRYPAAGLLAGILAFLLGACDAAPGPGSPAGRPPVVSDLAFSPRSVSPEALGDQGAGATVQIPVTLSVSAIDVDGRVQEVGYVVQSPRIGALTVAEGALAAAGANRYTASFTLPVGRGEVGKYTILVYAVDDEGLLGNDARGLLNYMASGRPPSIVSVAASPPVIRPPTTLKIEVTVDDPDGVQTVVRVVGTTPNGSAFTLFDDGRTQGDAAAGDGRFTATFNVDRATPGVQTFSFKAFDLTGLESASVEKPITVE